jgi:hypothetical protein
VIKRPALEQTGWAVTLMFSGVAAGMFVMDFFGYYPLLLRLSDRAAIELHQQAVGLHRGIFQLATASAGVACIIVIRFFSRGTSRGLLIASLACLIALIVYTNFALVPLNREIATWIPAAPPAYWKARFSDMIFRERLRTFLPVVAFVLALAASQHRD